MSTLNKILTHFKEKFNKRHGQENLLTIESPEVDAFVLIYKTNSKNSNRSYFRIDYFRECGEFYHVKLDQIDYNDGEDLLDYQGVGDNMSFEEIKKEVIDSIAD